MRVQVQVQASLDNFGVSYCFIETGLEQIIITSQKRQSNSMLRHVNDVLHASPGFLLVFNSSRIPFLDSPACHSHNFLLHIKAFGVDFGTVGPGTSNIETRKMITAGATRAHMARSAVLIFSLLTNGKLISASMRENGRLLGVIMEKTAPTAAAAMMMNQSST
jgi:hypothetical protein